jgi:hypothetical protein
MHEMSKELFFCRRWMKHNDTVVSAYYQDENGQCESFIVDIIMNNIW